MSNDRLILFTAALVAAVSISSCVKYQARPLDPPRSEQQFRARSITDPGLVAFLKRPDWPPAQLTLNDLYAVAIYFNPEVDVARARYVTAQAAIVTARTRPNPSVAIGGGYTNSPESPLVFSFAPVFTLETSGKRAIRTLGATKLAEAARIDIDAAAWQAMSKVRSAWAEYAMARKTVDVLTAEADLKNEVVAILEKRVAAGEGARPEVEAARAALIAVQVEVRTAQTAASEAAANLAAATGLPVLPPVSAAAARTTAVADVQKAGLLHRIDIRRSLLEYAADEAALQLEIAKQKPDIQFSPGYNFDEGHHKITFGPGFEIPLFNRNKGPIAEAQARRAESEVRFNALQAQAIGEMDAALAGLNGAQAELNDAETRLTTIGAARVASMRRLVAAGEEDSLALAGVRVEAAAAERARLEAERRVQEALTALDNAVQQPLESGTALPDPAAKGITK